MTPDDRRRRRPLVPTWLVDEHTQKQTVLALFFLYQLWKVYDLVYHHAEAPTTTNTNAPGFVAKYAVADTVFVMAVRLLGIDGLYLSWLQAVAAVAALIVATWLLALLVHMPLVASVGALWRHLSHQGDLLIEGDTVRGDVVDYDAHFLGRLTINYLPDSLAKFNPFNLLSCFDTANNPVKVPIEFNTTTTVGTFEIEHVGPDNVPRYTNYTGRRLKQLLNHDYTHLRSQPKFKDSERVTYVEVPVLKVGQYRLTRVWDHKLNPIRVYRGHFTISNCPYASYVYPAMSPYQCVGTQFEADGVELPLVEMVGVAPMTATVKIAAENTPQKTVTIKLGAANHEANDKLWLAPVFAAQYPVLKDDGVDFAAILGSKHATKVGFHIMSIHDGLGHSQRYNPEYKGKDLWFEYELKRAPQFSLYDANADVELVTGGTKKLGVKVDPTPQLLEFPLSVTVLHQSLNQSRDNHTITFANAHELKQGITIGKPGIYKLASGLNKWCGADVDTQDAVNITLAKPPTVDIVATPIKDVCLGTIGYNFGFELAGKAPFVVEYHVYRNQLGRLVPVGSEGGVHRLTTSSTHDKLEFRPERGGNYVVSFSSIKDSLHAPIALDGNLTYGTYFNQVSRAELTGPSVIHLCYNQSTQVPIRFSGNGPYYVTYNIVNAATGSVVSRVTNATVDGDTHVVDIPRKLLRNTPKVKVFLEAAQDKFHCKADVDPQASVTVVARTDIPTLEFAEAKEYTIAEGTSVRIPLKWQLSTGPSKKDKVRFKLIDGANDPPKFIRQLQVLSMEALVAKEQGIYQLVLFENGGCSGRIVNNEQTVKVSFFPKPTVSIASPHEIERLNELVVLKLVCEDAFQPLELTFDGVPPFTLDYQLQLALGEVETRVQRILGHTEKIELPTNENGDYKLSITKVWDNNYKRGKSQVDTVDITAAYSVAGKPDVSFAELLLAVCENQVKRYAGHLLPINLVGVPPFTVEAVLTHQATGVQVPLHFDDVVGGFLELPPSQLTDSLTLGTHTVEIKSIRGANGCFRNSFALPQLVTYTIDVTPVPLMVKASDRYHFCVGDHVAYNLTGTAPFTLDYTFAGKQRQASLEHHFRRLASEAGILSMTRLQDSSPNQCAVEFVGDEQKLLELEVHEIPSVKVQKGDYIVEDIHEGEYTELRFSFQGEPPFSLTYIRTTVATRLGVPPTVLETIEVDDIWEREYVVKASLEGTYEATRIADKYCVAVRSHQ